MSSLPGSHLLKLHTPKAKSSTLGTSSLCVSLHRQQLTRTYSSSTSTDPIPLQQCSTHTYGQSVSYRPAHSRRIATGIPHVRQFKSIHLFPSPRTDLYTYSLFSFRPCALFILPQSYPETDRRPLTCSQSTHDEQHRTRQLLCTSPTSPAAII